MPVRLGLIYKFTSPSNKMYIGKTVQSFSQRMYGHKKKSSGCTALKNAINKYGWAEMKREIVEENIPEDQLNDREKYWIKTYNTIAPHGYNLTDGGEGGSHSDIAKVRMEESTQKNAIAKNGYRGCVQFRHGLFYPIVTANKSQVCISRGCKTHEEAVEILRRYTADPENFEMPKRIRPRGSGTVCKQSNKWRVQLRGKHIGLFGTEEEARQALRIKLPMT
jgi:group I intron endonuclease